MEINTQFFVSFNVRILNKIDLKLTYRNGFHIGIKFTGRVKISCFLM